MELMKLAGGGPQSCDAARRGDRTMNGQGQAYGIDRYLYKSKLDIKKRLTTIR